MDQHAIEDLFERNADMRLLERRHADVGVARPAVESRGTAGSFGAESIMPSAQAIAADKSPRLRVTVAAAPMTGVIPGAIVGIAVDVHNDGGAPGPESTLTLPLPLDTEFRNGTLRLDGREVLGPERLFGSGLPIPRILGDASTKVTLQIAVLPGVSSIFLQPRLTTEGVPVVGTIGIAVKRGTISTAPLNAPPEKPFYEFEDEEIDALPDVERELPILPVIAPEIVPEPIVAALPPPRVEQLELAVPVSVPEAEPVTTAQPLPKARERAIAPAEPAGAEAVAANDRYRALGTAEIALLERLFTVEPPGTIAHYVLMSTIACTQGAGNDGGVFDAFVRHDLASLSRALVQVRLGKPTPYRIAAADFEALPANEAPGGEAPPLAAGKRRLHRGLRRAETSAIAALAQRSDRDPTLRFRIALLALAASSVEGVPDQRVADDCVAMLASYRANALAWLVPLCASSAGQPAFEVKDPHANLDLAARRLVTALRAALA